VAASFLLQWVVHWMVYSPSRVHAHIQNDSEIPALSHAKLSYSGVIDPNIKGVGDDQSKFLGRFAGSVNTEHSVTFSGQHVWLQSDKDRWKLCIPPHRRVTGETVCRRWMCLPLRKTTQHNATQDDDVTCRHRSQNTNKAKNYPMLIIVKVPALHSTFVYDPVLLLACFRTSRRNAQSVFKFEINLAWWLVNTSGHRETVSS